VAVFVSKYNLQGTEILESLQSHPDHRFPFEWHQKGVSGEETDKEVKIGLRWGNYHLLATSQCLPGNLFRWPAARWSFQAAVVTPSNSSHPLFDLLEIHPLKVAPIGQKEVPVRLKIISLVTLPGVFFSGQCVEEFDKVLIQRI
jgi:hypothetical protein